MPEPFNCCHFQLPNRLGKMLAPLHWQDYKKKYGKLDDFVAGHPELFLIEGDYIQLRDGEPTEECSVHGFQTGDLYDHESLLKAIKEVDVVISTVGHALLADQTKIIAAIKEAGANIKQQLLPM
ncbi:hypothetical protein Nepgr_028002 [Nepenthes gracilis]|uniref:Uncharacterized protein n=1 Tax=Nepenthes gracilis TaxID=150966 RepID=A0AAD3Y3N8_NEPGR|nr:hypothetical protein Nepgr_028002 [Nepenthes gracilis]